MVTSFIPNFSNLTRGFSRSSTLWFRSEVVSSKTERSDSDRTGVVYGRGVNLNEVGVRKRKESRRRESRDVKTVGLCHWRVLEKETGVRISVRTRRSERERKHGCGKELMYKRRQGLWRKDRLSRRRDSDSFALPFKEDPKTLNIVETTVGRLRSTGRQSLRQCFSSIVAFSSSLSVLFNDVHVILFSVSTRNHKT